MPASFASQPAQLDADQLETMLEPPLQRPIGSVNQGLQGDPEPFGV
jgi:hypothetical protein